MKEKGLASRKGGSPFLWDRITFLSANKKESEHID